MAKKTVTKKQQVTDTKNKKSVEKATGLELDKALGSLSSTSINVQGLLSKVGEDLVTKHSQLQAVDETIALRKKELEDLHGADKILLTIDELQVEHQKKVAELAESLKEAQSEFTKAVQAEAEIRTKEQADYDYNLAQVRKQDVDRWEEQVRIRNRDEAIRQENFNKQVAEREFALKAKETDYQTAISKSVTFDVEVDKKVKEEVAKATSAQKREYEHQISLTAVRHTSEVEKFQTDNGRLLSTNTQLTEQIRELQTQLRASQDAQTQLAKEAIAAASNAKAQADALSLMTNIGGGNRGKTVS